MKSERSHILSYFAARVACLCLPIMHLWLGSILGVVYRRLEEDLQVKSPQIAAHITTIFTLSAVHSCPDGLLGCVIIGRSLIGIDVGLGPTSSSRDNFIAR
ncbi:hypothetical protein A0H81_11516 [Grifola frondosa]|uniref:Uncharacterized protein n=1 Tax=Grifola frondosa TaxID=5627 RepID=A0A1C7LWG0_GRIFR|nr:hypothetical protein A0H81_11516 [Grifola frondosa]